MESLGYVLVYLLKGKLPWSETRGEKSQIEKWNKIFELKQKTDLKKLCQDIPDTFINYFEHVRSLKFKEKPNYKYLRNLFISLFKKNSFQNDAVYDWNDKKISQYISSNTAPFLFIPFHPLPSQQRLHLHNKLERKKSFLERDLSDD